MATPNRIALGLILCLGKAFVVYKHVTLWRKRAERMKKSHGGNSDRTQLPFVPTLGALSFVTYLSFFLLTALDLANAHNGWAGALYAIGWVAFGAMSIFYFLKMLRLGKRLIPLSRKIVSSGAAFEIKGEELGKFDALGRVLFVVECVSVLAQFVLFAVVGVVFPLDMRVVMAALGVMAGFLSVHTMSVLWLVERTVSAIKRSHFKSSNSDSNNNTSSGMRSDLQAIVNKMREQQLIIFLLASSGALVYILILSGAIPLTWYIMIIHMFYDLIANLVIVFSMARKAKRHHQQNQPLQSPRTPMQSPIDDAPPSNNNTLAGISLLRGTSIDEESAFGPKHSASVAASNVAHPNQEPSTEMGMMMIYESKVDDGDDE
jgi:hypothetical protein